MRSMKAALTVALTVVFASGLHAGLVAEYTFSNSGALGADSSGNGYNLTLQGTGTLGFDASALGGQGAAIFNGNEYLSASTFPGLVPTGDSPYTIAVWIDPSTTAAEYGILGWGDYSPDEANALRTSDSGQDGYNGIDNYSYYNDLGDTDNNVFSGQWLFVVATDDGNTRTVYIDPEQDGPSATDTAGSIDVQATDFTVGRAIPGCCGVSSLGQTFVGEMADLSIYNTAMTESQIVALQEDTSTPEPGTLTLFSLPALVLLLRRRFAR